MKNENLKRTDFNEKAFKFNILFGICVTISYILIISLKNKINNDLDHFREHFMIFYFNFLDIFLNI